MTHNKIKTLIHISIVLSAHNFRDRQYTQRLTMILNQNVSALTWGMNLYGRIGHKTVWIRDTSAWHQCRKCPLGTLALRHFSPNAETIWTMGLDTSVLGPRHFGTTLESYLGFGCLASDLHKTCRPRVFCFNNVM